MTRNQALDAAIALSRSPSFGAAMRTRPLPDDVRLVLAVLAGEAGALATARDLTGLGARALREAAEFYALQVMLFRGSPSHRVLGISANADRAEARAHLRLLLMWLHPDRNAGEWQGAFAARVIAAWKSLGGAEEHVERRSRPLAVFDPSLRLRWSVELAEIAKTPKQRPSRRLPRAAIACFFFAAGMMIPSDAANSLWFDAMGRAFHP